MSIAKPSVVSIHGVAAVIPANAEPLLLLADVNAYRTSVKPCCPGFQIVVWRTEGT